MIELKEEGDLFAAPVQVLVNPVNCVGVCGKGLALDFKNLFPDNYATYRAVCDSGLLHPGALLWVPRESKSAAWPKFIVNFPTKRDWRDRSKEEDIEAGLVALVEGVQKRDIRSIAIPALGCGLGGLDWEAVHYLIRWAFAPIYVRPSVPDFRVLLYPPRK